MENHTISIVIILVSILMSAYFSATETAFSSLNRIRMKNMAEKGNKRARLVMRLSEDYDSLLSTILIGNKHCKRVPGDGAVRKMAGGRGRSQRIHGGDHRRCPDFRRSDAQKHCKGIAGEVRYVLRAVSERADGIADARQLPVWAVEKAVVRAHSIDG